MEYHGEYDIYYLGRGDPYVFTEQRRDYGRIAPRARGQNVLDFGAHCGFFNVFISRFYPPAKIISVEPDPRAEEVLKKNCRPDTEIIMAAVVDQAFMENTINLYLGKTFSATNSIEQYRGREEISVPVVPFQALTDAVDFIKCDCEGGEYSLDWSDLPKRIHTIAIEFHFNRPWWEDQMHVIDDQLLSQGFTHVKAPKVNNFQKINTGLYVRS